MWMTVADGAADFDESSHFERLIPRPPADSTPSIGPGLSATTGTKAELLARLEGAVDELLALFGDGLCLELLLLHARDGVV
ncbi:MAG: hypothetical protein L0H93_15465 [Nocardioides sp.]|nr:hypothetical protein [Nocardioides sp.]